MARTFEFGMRAGMRGNCSKDIAKFQEASKAPLLHMFNIHTHCTESFCSIRKQSRETLRMYLIFDSLFDPSKTRSKTDKCLDVNASLTEEEERLLCKLILELEDYSHVKQIRHRIRNKNNLPLITDLRQYFHSNEYPIISFSEEKVLFQELHNQMKAQSKKDAFKMKVSSFFRTPGDPKSFLTVSKQKTKIHADFDADFDGCA
jgi:hypothetical protein